jgi:hypothetical protein
VVNRVVGGASRVQVAFFIWVDVVGPRGVGRPVTSVLLAVRAVSESLVRRRLAVTEARVLLLNSNASVNSQNPRLLATSTCEQQY